HSRLRDGCVHRGAQGRRVWHRDRVALRHLDGWTADRCGDESGARLWSGTGRQRLARPRGLLDRTVVRRSGGGYSVGEDSAAGIARRNRGKGKREKGKVKQDLALLFSFPFSLFP